MKIVYIVALCLFVGACRVPEKLPSDVGTGDLIGHNHVTGAVVKYTDGDVVCYSSQYGLSCLKTSDKNP